MPRPKPIRFAVLAAPLLAAVAPPPAAAEPPAIVSQCAVCHGESGISTGAPVPHLAGQLEDYLAAQLGAFRSGDRANPFMTAVAVQLSDAEIAAAAKHFAAQQGAGPGARSATDPGLRGDGVAFPAGYRDSFVEYDRIEFPEKGEIQRFLANPVAVEGLKSGGGYPDGSYLLVEVHAATPGPDGALIEGPIVGFGAMEKRAGAGAAVPELLRNGDWRFGIYAADGSPAPDGNEALCLACHQPLAGSDYSFTLGALKAHLGL